MKKFSFIKTKKNQAGVIRTLKAIKRTIDTPEKWIKEDFDNGEGQYCVLGASRHVDGPFEDLATRVLILSLTAQWAPSKESIIEIQDTETYVLGNEDYEAYVFDFNDSSKIQHKHVMDLLDRAIKNVETAI